MAQNVKEPVMIVNQPKIIRGRVIPHRRNVAPGVASLKEYAEENAKEKGVKGMTKDYSKGNPLSALKVKRLLPDVFDRWDRCLWSRIDRIDVGKGLGANKMVGLTHTTR
jgi:hypothetical protein